MDYGYERRYQEWLSGMRTLIYGTRVMSQAALARQVNVARERLNGVLRGRLDAGAALQDRLCEALGYSYDDLRAIGRGRLESDSLPGSSGAMEVGVVNDGGVHVKSGAVHVTGSVRACAVPGSCSSEGGELGDIGRDLCAVIAKQLEGKNLDQRIAFRAALLDFVRQYNGGEGA